MIRLARGGDSEEMIMISAKEGRKKSRATGGRVLRINGKQEEQSL
jgi:hypothetical protein